jgi:MoxR-like ATPase
MGDSQDISSDIEAFCRDWRAITDQVSKVIVAHEQVTTQVLTCLFTGGHGLLEGVPGIGKTLLVRTLGSALNLSFSRIQFTPDLMPADITGTNILEVADRGERSFRFQEGPIFANLVLADEINRATPKTQSAVLEAMQEGTVSVARTTYELPRPLVVLATQNPIELEGTYPLPEAQLDRFMLKIAVDSPSADDIVEILNRTTADQQSSADAVVDGSRIEEMKRLVLCIPAPSHVSRYIARLVAASHPRGPDAPDLVKKYVRFGCSPRAAQAIMLAAKVGALIAGRANVSFEDVDGVLLPAIRHRIILNFEGQAEGITGASIAEALLEAVPRTGE